MIISLLNHLITNDISNAERYAIRYDLIVVAEALTSLCIYLARGVCGEKLEAHIHCHRIIRDRNLVSSEEFGNFIKSSRLRNLLMIRYR